MSTDDANTPMEADFLKYLQGFVTQILIHLGEIDNPLQGKKTVELELAKYSIDLLTPELVGQMVDKTLDDVEGAVLDKGLKGHQKKKVEVALRKQDVRILER